MRRMDERREVAQSMGLTSLVEPLAVSIGWRSHTPSKLELEGQSTQQKCDRDQESMIGISHEAPESPRTHPPADTGHDGSEQGEKARW